MLCIYTDGKEHKSVIEVVSAYTVVTISVKAIDISYSQRTEINTFYRK